MSRLVPILLIPIALVSAEPVTVRITASGPVKASKLRPGSMVEGAVERDVFAGERLVVPAGAKARLVVQEASPLPRSGPGWARRIPAMLTGASWPKREYAVSLRSAEIVSPDGKATPVPATVLGLGVERRLTGGSRKAAARQSTVVLGIPRESLGAGTPAVPRAGVPFRVALTRNVRASESQTGDEFEARLAEPVLLGPGAILPAGTRIDGRVIARQGLRRMFRPAKLRLTFPRIHTASEIRPVAAVISGASAEAGAGGSMDAEGGISGGPAGKARMLIDVGAAYATGKILDDLLEEGLKWGFGPAISGSAATAARYVGLGAGGVLLLLQRGRDVNLPAYSELELTIARAPN